MAEERKAERAHRLVADGRETVSVSGVSEVISFDGNSAVVETSKGILIIKGTGLHMKGLDLDGGTLEAGGEIGGFLYEDGGGYGRGKGSLLKKIFK